VTVAYKVSLVILEFKVIRESKERRAQLVQAFREPKVIRVLLVLPVFKETKGIREVKGTKVLLEKLAHRATRESPVLKEVRVTLVMRVCRDSMDFKAIKGLSVSKAVRVLVFKVFKGMKVFKVMQAQMVFKEIKELMAHRVIRVMWVNWEDSVHRVPTVFKELMGFKAIRGIKAGKAT